MADKKISQLPTATLPLAGTEVLPIVQGGTTDQVSVANLTAGRTQTSNGIVQGTAGTGYNFTANTPAAGMTSQLLNWYEEGTWTPYYTNVPSAPTTPYTMAVVSAKYTRIGRAVHIQAYIRTSNVNITGASGDLVIGGLPFTVGSGNYGSISISNASGWATNTPWTGYFNPNTTQIGLQFRSSTTGSDTACTATALTTGASANKNVLFISGIYLI